MDKITDSHKELLACVYVRQSSLGQVHKNRESTKRQLKLQGHAEELGWSSSRIVLIDEDLGLSGINTTKRPGYQRLFSMIKENKVGLILATEMSRLGRDNIEWQILMRHCSFFNILLSDENIIYDPREPHDQVLLGLLGAIAEYELSQIGERMLKGSLNKAKRGELHSSVPAGYTLLSTGAYVKDPNRRVQEAIATIFEKFMSFSSVGTLCRWCCDNGIEVPSYVGGKGRGQLCWKEATVQRLSNILNNPTFAGCYVHGRRRTEKFLSEDGQIMKRVVRKQKAEWRTVIKDNHEAYISWSQYERNLERLKANNPMTKRHAAGPTHKGEALLAGLLRCRECGNKLQVGYSAKGVVRYICRNGTKQRAGRSIGCFSFQGKAMNHMIEEQVLEVVEPAGIEAALQAFDLLKSENMIRRQSLLNKVEQYQYEADRAFRQFDCSDPENRLVTGELEKRWNKSLNCLSSVTSELEKFERELSDNILPEEREEFLLLGEKLRNTWFASESSMILKKQIIRVLVEEIIVTLDKEKNIISGYIHWSGGQHTAFQLPQKTRKSAENSEVTDNVKIIQMLRDIVDDCHIAQILNRAGINRKTGASWTKKRVEDFRKRHGIPVFNEKEKQEKGLLLQQEAANRLGISPMSVHRLIKMGEIPAKQAFAGSPWIIQASLLETESVKKAVENIKSGSFGPVTENQNQLSLW